MTRHLTTRALAALLLLTAPAAAHVTFETPEAPAGGTAKFVLRVPHGCDGQATLRLSLRIPEGVFAVKPMPKPDWRLETVTAPYARAYSSHGTPAAEGVTEIVWSEGELPDAYYDEFVFRGSLADDLAPGSVLRFPAVQTCADGTEAWTDLSDDGAMPAPQVTVAAPAAAQGHAHAMPAAGAPVAGHAAPAAVRLGPLALSDAFTRATTPRARVAGGYVTIADTGHEGDRLVAATSPLAEEVQIHEMAMQGEVMTMRRLPEGAAVPPGGRLEMTPGSLHLMFLGLKGQLVEGSTLPVTLTFERAGSVTLALPVLAVDATAAHRH